MKNSEHEVAARIWVWYYFTCERHDLRVCMHPSGMPHRASERQLVTRFASRCRRVVRFFTATQDLATRNFALDAAHDVIANDIPTSELEVRFPGYKVIAREADQLLGATTTSKEKLCRAKSTER